MKLFQKKFLIFRKHWHNYCNKYKSSANRGESKFFLTAEHAETAEFQTTKARNKDIFYIGSGLSGAASLILVFLSDLRDELLRIHVM